MTTPADVAARVIELATLHPEAGYNRLEAMLALEGRQLSAIAVRKMLKKTGFATPRRHLRPHGENYDKSATERRLPPAGAELGNGR